MSTSPPEAEGSGDEQERVRRLLADLALTDEVAPPAMPPEVAARLDAALAAEAAPSADATRVSHDVAEDTSGSTVVPLRRRVLPALVAAATLVVVAGGATAVVVQQQDDSRDSAASSAGAASADEGGAEAAEPPPTTFSEDSSQASSEAPSEAPSGAPSEPEPEPGAGQESGSGDVRMVQRPYLADATLGEDAARLVADGEVAAPDSPADRVASERSTAEGSGCAVPPADRGAATFVSLDGDPATLVVGPLVDGERAVELVECGTGEVLSQVRIESGPAPGR